MFWFVFFLLAHRLLSKLGRKKPRDLPCGSRYVTCNTEVEVLAVSKSWQEPELFLPLPKHVFYAQGVLPSSIVSFYHGFAFPALNLHLDFFKHGHLDL